MALMKAKGYIDVLIPRGGAGLIRAVIENAIVPINSMNKTINVCKSILFLPHFYTDISTNISSFCLKFYHKGFAFSIMLHTF